MKGDNEVECVVHPSGSNRCSRGQKAARGCQEVCSRSSGAWNLVKGDIEEVVWCILMAAIGVQGEKCSKKG